MPLTMKVSRKVGVALSKPKAKLRPRCSDDDEHCVKAGLGIRLSKRSGVSAIAKKEKTDHNRSCLREASSITSFSKSQTKAGIVSNMKQRHGAFEPAPGKHFIRKRAEVAEVGLLDGNFCKSISANENSKSLGKKVQSGSHRGLKGSSRNSSFRGRETHGSEMGKTESVLQSNRRGNSLRSGPIKMEHNPKIHLSTEKDATSMLRTVGCVKKPHQKMATGTKFLNADAYLVETLPKKKKRVIRLDPHDISNKRLADDAAFGGSYPTNPDRKEDSGPGLSKNAQFRAIQPSLSILSFVEENLLGRRRDIELRRAGYNTEMLASLDNIPFSSGSERERIEVPVFRNRLEFFAAAKTSFSFPSPDLPEIAFAGRSNVGKSSLLNALTRQWGVVRTSDKPGLTQTINFFKLGQKLCLVDLPGYGFAYADVKVKEAWQKLVKEYVATRSSLQRVCLLVDTKWGMKPMDGELVDLMEQSQTKYQIVLTKTDLVSPIDVARRAMEIEENLKANKSALKPLMMVSSKTGAGIRSLRTVLSNVARLVKC